jgi:hypothetical protein
LQTVYFLDHELFTPSSNPPFSHFQKHFDCKICCSGNENRQCLKCNSRSIGDKFHYIMECHFFTENRTQLISRYLIQRPNILKFKQIMCISEKTKLEKLCRFTRKINRSDIVLANT